MCSLMVAHMKDTIPPNATIEDVLPTLSDPEEYVRTVVSTMAPCYVKHGNASVRIGITGEGKMPYHKVSYKALGDKEELYEAYGGGSPFYGVTVHQNTWSTRSMSYDEVRAL